jgi:Xaa-Pro aminopeptidase
MDRVAHYIEYPCDPHPMAVLKAVLDDMGLAKPYGADQDGYPWIYGYRGPTLGEMLGQLPKFLSAFVEDQMMIKSPGELKLIEESIKWGNLAHTLLQRYTRPGLTENEVSLRASHEATLKMLDAIGPIYRSQNPYSDGASAGYRGQIGRGASIPHAMSGNIVFQAGDVVVSGAGAPVWGYNSELERTMILGPANDEQKRLFEHMLALQDLAIGELKPGARCCDVDRAVKAYYQEHDLQPYWKHHTGHAIGLREHESPFLDIGDQTMIKPGMVFTIEPGLYSPGLGGFRHSDTVAITEDGSQIMTYYPHDLESLTIPI